MGDRFIIAVAAFVAACSPAPRGAKVEALTGAEPAKIAEPFLVAAVVDDVDIVGDRRDRDLSAGKKLHGLKGQRDAVSPSGEHRRAPFSAWFVDGTGGALPETWSKEVALSSPEGTELRWAWIGDSRSWESVVLQSPAIVTVHDVASAAIQPVAEQSALVVELTDEAASRLEAFARKHPDHRMAEVLGGIVTASRYPIPGSSLRSFVFSPGAPGRSETELRAIADAITRQKTR